MGHGEKRRWRALIRDCFSRDGPLEPARACARHRYRKYVLVGGLPEAVQAYALGQAFPQIRGIRAMR